MENCCFCGKPVIGNGNYAVISLYVGAQAPKRYEAHEGCLIKAVQKAKAE